MNPRRREDDLVVEHTGTEVLLYDLRTNAAHHLDAAASQVWDVCDGESSLEDIVAATGLTAEAVDVAIEQLTAINVVDGVRGHTRRDTIKRGLVGVGVVVALPVVKSIVAPEAAMAAVSCTVGTVCMTAAQCCPTAQFCSGGFCSTTP